MRASVSQVLFLFTAIFSIGRGFSYRCGRERNSSTPAIERLQADLLCDYDSYSRPVKNPSTRIGVDLSFVPIFYEIEEDDETIRISGYIQMSWTDELLQWKPSKYNKITEFKTEYYDVWYPRITSYDSSNSWYQFLDSADKYKFDDVLIRSNGSVTSRITFTLFGPCSVDYSKWPFEDWDCKFTVTSRGDDTNNIIVNFDPQSDIVMSKFIESRKWKILTNPAFQEYPDPENVELYIKLQRNTSHYQIAFIYPGIVLLLLTFISFWLTNKIYCRMMINMMTAILQMAFLQDLYHILEENGSEDVKIYSFFLDSLFISFAGILCAVLSAKMITKVDDPPQWLTELIGIFAVVPYCGPVFSFLVNEDINSSAKFDDEEAALVSTTNNKSNQKWRIVANFIDKVAFLVIVLFLFFIYVL